MHIYIYTKYVYIYVCIYIYIYTLYLYIICYIYCIIYNTFLCIKYLYSIYIHTYILERAFIWVDERRMPHKYPYAASNVCACCLKRMRMLLGGHAGSTRDVCCLICIRMLPQTYTYRCRLAYGSTRDVCCRICMRMRPEAYT